MSLRERVKQLRDELAGLPLSLPELADKYDVPLSALYRFTAGNNVKLETLYKIDELVSYES